MAKIMLVEDDNNLREIYEARLLAEGYEIVSAHDGEEALAMAVKERPDLVISDVMMPKISGFDMLDILRGTPETANTKVIMMTALSQSEDKDRADKLGADRYLVKSQVTLEDVARVAREVLEGTPAPNDGTGLSGPATELPAVPTPAADPAPTPPASEPVVTPDPTPAPAAAPDPAPMASDPVAAPADPPTPPASEPVAASVAPMPSTTPESAEPPTPPLTPAPEPTPEPEPAAALTEPTAELAAPPAETEGVESPVPAPEAPASEPTPSVELPEPPVAEEATEQLAGAQTAAAEEQTVEKQIESFVNTGTVEPPAINIGADGTVSAADPNQDAEEAAPAPADLKLPSAWTMPDTNATETPAEPAATEPQEQPAPTKSDTTETPDVPTTDMGGTQKKVIKPLHDVGTGPDLNALLAKEEEKEQVAQIIGNAGVAPPAPMPPVPGQTNHPSDESKPQDPNLMAL